MAALFAQSGVLRMETLEEVETARALAGHPLPQGRRLAVVGNAGGAEVLAADAAGALGIDVPEFSTATEDELLEATGAVGAANPVDLGAAATPQTLEQAIRVVLTSGEVDAVLVNYAATRAGNVDDTYAALACAAAGATIPVLVKCLGAPDADPQVLVADGSKLPVFPFPEAAVRALGHAMQYADWRARPQGVVPTAGRNQPTSRPMSRSGSHHPRPSPTGTRATSAEQGGMTCPDTTKVPSGWCVSALPCSRRADEGRGDRTSSSGGRPTMKALVYNGPGQRDWREVPEPTILEPEDAIVRVDAVTICGTDLHILKGDVPTVDSGRVLGHEAVGTVTEVGDGVRGVTPGDQVLISCISSCGRCEYCREGRYGQCLGGGGWILGHRIDGTQAEMVRVPFADRSMYKLPVNVSNESALLLADILPTAYEVGTLSGRVSPGDTVVIVGAGPIGLSAITTSKLFSPSRVVVVDVAVSRQKAAMEHGADLALGPDEDVVETVRGFTNGLGANVAIEAVGVPATFELCTQVIRPGGRVANVGVHGAPATLHLEELWIKDVTITTGLVDTSSTPRLLSMLASGRLAMPGLITHRFGLDEMQDAYDVFSRAAETGALKVALFNEESLGQERQ